MIVAVADAGPIIHLAEIDAVDLLGTVDELFVPETVRDELEAGGIPREFANLEFEAVVAEGTGREFDGGLDEGETAALAVATERDAVLLTDDMAARDAAKEAGIDVHGSIGVVTLAFRRGELTEDRAVELMRSLQTETSLFVTDAVVEHGIDILRAGSDEETGS